MYARGAEHQSQKWCPTSGSPPRRVPVALREKVREELDRMESLGVVEKVKQPSKWVNSMVTVRKKNSDKVRICIYPRDLNDAIEREHFPMQTIEEVMTRISGANYSLHWMQMLDIGR